MPRRVNLVPKTERVRTATNVPALALLAVGVVVLFAVVLSYYLLSSSRSTLQEDYNRVSVERAALEQQVAALGGYKQLETQRIGIEKVVQGVYAGRTLVSKVLSDLSRVVPENVWFTSLNISAGDPQTKAEAASPNAGTMISGVGSLTLQGNTYSFPDVALLLVRLRLVESLQGITLNSAGDPIGNVDESKHVRGFSLVSLVFNTQPADTPLPVTKVEVEGL